nr:MAG TPA: hypothetical protein [Caudoviricetes sp.]
MLKIFLTTPFLGLKSYICVKIVLNPQIYIADLFFISIFAM